MIRLVPMNASEYQAFRTEAIPAYAAEKVASGQWPEDAAHNLARKAFDVLLPQGIETRDTHLLTIQESTGSTAVGTLWFAIQDRAGKPIAYVYHVNIAPEHQRKGYASSALLALEDKAQKLGLAGVALHVFARNTTALALYRKLGYQTTDINMYKPVEQDVGGTPLDSERLHRDAFVHLPVLHRKIVPPEKSRLRTTPEVLASWDAFAARMGYPANWRLTDRELETSRHTVLGQLDPADDLWIYAYGSTMWDPGLDFAEVRVADLEEYQRRFAHKTNIGRGTPHHPALMLSIEPRPGTCRGMAFRLAADKVDTESAIYWRREMLLGGYLPVMLPVSTPQGSVTALVLTSDTTHPGYMGELPLENAVAMIANASGIQGSNRDYLEQLAAQLATLGIEDSYIENLLQRVRILCSR